ncbi:MAG: GNAT family N-acetyltransferase [Eubacteriaceae bacterium]|nr:GNAT family N-acetyltransferase [Eubacteriaceae bacterium]
MDDTDDILFKAAPSDLDEIDRMFDETIAEMEKNGIHLWNEHYPREVLPEDIEKQRLYILRRGGKVIGAFALANDEDEEYEPGTWEDDNAPCRFLNRLAVDPSCQRQGIARRLIADACRIAKDEGAGYLRLFVADFNQPAVSLYEKTGFMRSPVIKEAYLYKDKVIMFGYEKKLS